MVDTCALVNLHVLGKIVFTYIFLKFLQFYGVSTCRPLVICEQNILKHILSAFIAKKYKKFISLNT